MDADTQFLNLLDPTDIKGTPHSNLLNNIKNLGVTDDLTTIQPAQDSIKVSTVPKGAAEGVIAFKNYTDDATGKNFTKIHYQPFIGDTATVVKTSLNDKQIYVFGDDYPLGKLEKKIATAAITQKIRNLPRGTDQQVNGVTELTDKDMLRTTDPLNPGQVSTPFSVQFGAGGNRRKKGGSRRKRKTAKRLKLRRQRK
jgi:hypothetical protein